MKNVQSTTAFRVLLGGAVLWGSQLFATLPTTMSWAPNAQAVPLSTTSLMTMAAILLIAATWMLLKKQRQLPILIIAGVLVAGGYVYQAKANGVGIYDADQCTGTDVEIGYHAVFHNACGDEIKITDINRYCTAPDTNPCSIGTVLANDAICNICLVPD